MCFIYNFTANYKSSGQRVNMNYNLNKNPNVANVCHVQFYSKLKV